MACTTDVVILSVGLLSHLLLNSLVFDTVARHTAPSAWQLTALDCLMRCVGPQVRTPLNQLCLTVRALDLAPAGPRGVESFLLRAVTPPSDKAVANALDLLLRVGALDTSEALTPLGRSVTLSLCFPLPALPCISPSVASQMHGGHDSKPDREVW
jgi:hypothetical protein